MARRKTPAVIVFGLGLEKHPGTINPRFFIMIIRLAPFSKLLTLLTIYASFNCPKPTWFSDDGRVTDDAGCSKQLTACSAIPWLLKF
jgi:hypothetical protein